MDEIFGNQLLPMRAEVAYQMHRSKIQRLFPNVAPEICQLIALRLRWLCCFKDDTIVETGDPAMGVFFIHRGVAVLLDASAATSAMPGTLLGEDDSFGIESLVQAHPVFTHSVVARTTCDLFFLYRNDFFDILELFPRAQRSFAASAAFAAASPAVGGPSRRPRTAQSSSTFGNLYAESDDANSVTDAPASDGDDAANHGRFVARMQHWLARVTFMLTHFFSSPFPNAPDAPVPLPVPTNDASELPADCTTSLASLCIPYFLTQPRQTLDRTSSLTFSANAPASAATCAAPTASTAGTAAPASSDVGAGVMPGAERMPAADSSYAPAHGKSLLHDAVMRSAQQRMLAVRRSEGAGSLAATPATTEAEPADDVDDDTAADIGWAVWEALQERSPRTAAGDGRDVPGGAMGGHAGESPA